MKTYLISAIVTLILLVIIGFQYYQIKSVNDKWKVAEANVKAYSEELNTAGKKNTALQLSVSQLEYFNDSVLKALNETREELKIKDKNLKALQQVKSSFSRIDTIEINDTIFINPSFYVDTVLQDKWYKLGLQLKYPSTVTVSPEFKSEKHIVVSTKKETINPPKKFFLLRWFQKKHKVLNIDVIEKNPYVNGESSKYVEILK